MWLREQLRVTAGQLARANWQAPTQLTTEEGGGEGPRQQQDAAQRRREEGRRRKGTRAGDERGAEKERRDRGPVGQGQLASGHACPSTIRDRNRKE